MRSASQSGEVVHAGQAEDDLHRRRLEGRDERVGAGRLRRRARTQAAEEDSWRGCAARTRSSTSATSGSRFSSSARSHAADVSVTRSVRASACA